MSDEIQITGTVSGGSIQFDRPLSLSDGQRVVVAVRPVGDKSKGEGLRASAGGWADAGPELDEWLAEVYEARRATRGLIE
jgi:hypothetical protein